jgi:RecA/RadA recombinase
MLLGREAELVACAEAGPGRPLQVFGPAGIGKTTLLARVAATALAPADGVRFVGGAGRSVGEPAGPLSDSLRALVVVDDVELGGDERESLFAAAPRCTFIVGSAERTLVRRAVGAVA